MSPHILPFAEKYIGAAAHLLAARQQRDRRMLPMLPQRFEQTATAQSAIEAVWEKPWTSGAVAIHDDKVVGYLLGTPQIDEHRGRTIWIRPAGYGLSADGPNGSVDVELMRDLYAAAGPKWLERGCFEHFAMISTADRALLDAWYSLSFGQQQAHGLQMLSELNLGEPPETRGFTIRQARANDAPHLEKLCYITGEHQFHAPTWAPTPLEIMAGRPEDYRGVASDEEATTWLAFQKDKAEVIGSADKTGEAEESAIGFQIYYEAEPEPDDLYIPEGCIELCAAGTLAETRGQGVGLALTHAGLTHAKQAGYQYCLTDWRTTNLHASRFWPRRGFKPVIYRLHRRVDERIMWANKIQ